VCNHLLTLIFFQVLQSIIDNLKDELATFIVFILDKGLVDEIVLGSELHDFNRIMASTAAYLAFDQPIESGVIILVELKLIEEGIAEILLFGFKKLSHVT